MKVLFPITDHPQGEERLGSAESFTPTPKSHLMFNAKGHDFNGTVQRFHSLPISLQRSHQQAGRLLSSLTSVVRVLIWFDYRTCSRPGLVREDTTSKMKE